MASALGARSSVFVTRLIRFYDVLLDWKSDIDNLMRICLQLAFQRLCWISI